MAIAPRDANSIPVIMGVSSADGVTPTAPYVDPNTHRMLTSPSGAVTSVASADGSITVTNPTTTPDLAIVKSPKLTTGRTIAITGDLAYTSPSFDGTGNVTGIGTLATVNSNVGTFASFAVNGKGLITAATSLSGDITSSGAVT